MKKSTYKRADDESEILAEPEFVEELPEVVDEHTADICATCNGTGAVAANTIEGKVDKWKDCPDCMKCLNCTNGKLADASDCPICYKGRVPREKSDG